VSALLEIELCVSTPPCGIRCARYARTCSARKHKRFDPQEERRIPSDRLLHGNCLFCRYSRKACAAAWHHRCTDPKSNCEHDQNDVSLYYDFNLLAVNCDRSKDPPKAAARRRATSSISFGKVRTVGFCSHRRGSRNSLYLQMNSVFGPKVTESEKCISIDLWRYRN
jgi:hypothetical protein